MSVVEPTDRCFTLNLFYRVALDFFHWFGLGLFHRQLAEYALEDTTLLAWLGAKYCGPASC